MGSALARGRGMALGSAQTPGSGKREEGAPCIYWSVRLSIWGPLCASPEAGRLHPQPR